MDQKLAKCWCVSQIPFKTFPHCLFEPNKRNLHAWPYWKKQKWKGMTKQEIKNQKNRANVRTTFKKKNHETNLMQRLYENKNVGSCNVIIPTLNIIG